MATVEASSNSEFQILFDLITLNAWLSNSDYLVNRVQTLQLMKQQSKKLRMFAFKALHIFKAAN